MRVYDEAMGMEYNNNGMQSVEIEGENYFLEKHLSRNEVHNLKQRLGILKWAELQSKGMLKVNDCAVLYSGAYCCITKDAEIIKKFDALVARTSRSVV